VFAVAVPLAVVRAATAAALEIATLHSSAGSVLDMLVRLFLSGFLGTVLAGLLAPAISVDVLGHRLEPGASWRQARAAVLALIVLALLVAVAEEVGTVAAVVGGVWLWGIWAVAAPALVVERVGVGRALARSNELVRTVFWRVIGIRSLRWVLCYVLGFLITLPFAAIALAVTGTDLNDVSTLGVANQNLYVIILSIGTVLSIAVTSPISAAVDVLLYADLRMRREGMDLVLAAAPGGSAAVRAAVTA
jgi:hypothetical protein